MIDPNKVTEAVMEFMKNPEWKEIFTKAPGGAMERLAISFYFSKFHDQFQAEDFQEYRDLRDEYEKSMTEEDLNYLIENSDKDAAKKHYEELLTKLQQSGGQPKGQIRFEKEGEEGSQPPQGEDGGEQQPTEGTSEQTTEKVEESVQQGEDGQEQVQETIQQREDGQKNFEETATESTENNPPTDDDGLPPIDDTFAKQDEDESETATQEDKSESNQTEEDNNQEQDEKLNTALSVALNYLQNEEKQVGNAEGNDEKKK